MLRPLISTLVTTILTPMVAVILGVGPLGVGMATPASAAPREPAIELDTDLTLRVPRCEGCTITLHSSDGINPVYTSFPAIGVDGSVTITLPSVRTAGMSVQVDAPWVVSTSDSTSDDMFVAWRYAGTEIVDSMSFKESRSK